MFAYCNNNPVVFDDYGGFFGNCCVNVDTEEAIKNNKGVYSVIYDVPLYDQKDLKLCWAYCVLMIQSFRAGEELDQEAADRKAEEIARSFHGDDWNKGLRPKKIGKKKRIRDIVDLLFCLEDEGPLYAYYCSNKSAHLVVITGVNVYSEEVYTNNPWNIPGRQRYEDFLNGFVDLNGDTKQGYALKGIYVPK